MIDRFPVVTRLYDALARGDVAAARACCSPDVRVWHNFDCRALTASEAAEGWTAFCSTFPERYIADVRRTPLPNGVLQRHLQVVRHSDGTRSMWPICLIVTLRDDLIVRLDEYLDRAASLDEEIEKTPGLDELSFPGVVR